MAELTSCPRCGSDDVVSRGGYCRCSRVRGHCWHYPECLRCGYTNGQAVANSEGNVWFLDGMKTFGGGKALPLEITAEVFERICRYDSGWRPDEESEDEDDDD